MLRIGGNPKEVKDPTKLKSARVHFRRERVLPLPLSTTFPDTDDVYDWLAKTNGPAAQCGRKRCLLICPFLKPKPLDAVSSRRR